MLNNTSMERMVLVFPNTSSIVSFLMQHDVRNAEVNSLEQSLTCDLSEEDVINAVNEYGCYIYPFYNFASQKSNSNL